MAIKQTSKIEVRHGLQINLPQLSTGELGWAIDSQRLFIGNGDIDDGAPFVGNTEILTTVSEGSGNIIPVAGVPVGSQDGINNIFSLPSIPIPNTLILWQNFPLIPGVGYTLIGTTITFTTVPATTDNLFYQYWIT